MDHNNKAQHEMESWTEAFALLYLSSRILVKLNRNMENVLCFLNSRKSLN